MNRSIPLVALAAFALPVAAQFGNPFIAYHTDTRRPFALVLEDLDGDTDLDALIADQDSLYWFANDGSGGFGVHQGIDGYEMGPLTTQDIDADGDADIVASGNAWGPNSLDVGWYANDGTGQFTPMSLIAPWLGTYDSPQWADLDGDGDVDLVSRADSAVRVRFNYAGVFIDGPDLGDASFDDLLSIAVDDADDDGDNDVLVFGTVAGRGFCENLGAGTFAAPVILPAAEDDAVAGTWDKDNDGDIDLFLSDTRWLINDSAAQYTAGDTVASVLPGMLADADTDGDPDYFWSTTSFLNIWEGRNDGSTTTNIAVYPMNEFGASNVPLEAGDINGDGTLDLLSCHRYGFVFWCAGDGANNWSPPNTIGSPLTTVHHGAVTADFDLDGDLDMAAGGTIDDRLAWYPNDGTGVLGPQQVIADHMNRPDDLVVLDLELDGDSDLVLWNRLDTTVVRARNNGLGQFTVDTLAVQASQLAVGYFNADPYPDLVAGDAWYVNDGNGDFSLLADLGSLWIYDAACGDMDGDGQQDIVYMSYDLHVVKEILGGAYTTIVTVAPPVSVIALADLDLDGDLDVASISSGYSNYWFENDGTGALTQHVWHTVGFDMGACDLEAVDVTGDGAPDLVWAQGNNSGWIYMAQNDGQGGFGPSEVINPDASYALGFADMNGDLVPELWRAGPEFIAWQQHYYYVPYRLRGSVFQDNDLDAVHDTTEVKIPFQLVRSDANDLLIWTNSSGDYDHPADTGTWQVWSQHPAIYQVTNDPDTLTATLTTLAPVSEGLDLGFAPALMDTTGYLSVTASGNMQRCNADVTVWVHLQNLSTYIPHDIIVDVQLHPDLTFNSACTTPDSIVGDHYYWHVDSLGWFEGWGTCLHLTTGPVGSNSIVSASAIYVAAAGLIYTDQTGTAVIDCSFDPNDKLVTPVGYGAAGAVPIDQDRFTYTIRFQNTGTDTALNVVINDAFDPDLNWESMQVLAASHSLTSISVDEDGLATFRLDHILLPDSNVNEAASHGFIKYNLAPVPGAPHGTEITNTASILFDLNAPVVTNTTLNTLVDCSLFSASITLGGVDSLVATAGDAWQWFLDGDSLVGANGPSLVITAPGNYTVQVTSNYGCVSLSDPFQVISTQVPDTDDAHIALWPDPAHDRLFVDVPGPAVQAWILDANGRVHRNLLLSTGTNTLLLNGLDAGNYALRCGNGEVLRFVKQ